MKPMTPRFAAPALALALFAPIALGLSACAGEPDKAKDKGPADGNAPSILPELPALAEGPTIRDVSVQQASALISGDAPAIVIDVRTPDEFAQGHIEGAINVDVNSDTFIEDLAKLDKDTAYLVHCRSGKRSAKALEAMREASFTTIAHMNDGLNGWSEAGKPVVQ